MKEPRDGAADGADRTVQDCSFVELDFKGDKLVLPVEFTVINFLRISVQFSTIAGIDDGERRSQCFGKPC